MASPAVLFGAAAAGTIVALNVLLKPKTFRVVMIGIGVGATVGGGLTYMNRLRRHSVAASYVPIGLTAPAMKYSDINPVIYKHLTRDYEERGELELGEEHLTVKPHVFAQIGILDTDGVRRMWTSAVLPKIRAYKRGALFDDSSCTTTELEKDVVFCDIGSGVGNICLQVLAETNCKKTVGIEVIPSRIRAAEQATANAKHYFPELFKNKEAVWVEEDLVNCSEVVQREKVNVVFTHSWMFDDNLMKLLSQVLSTVPSVVCVVTSRKLNEEALSCSSLKLSSLTYFSADWNDEAPFYVYEKKVKS